MTSQTIGVVEEGKLVRVTANVADDVQVRNVEFYMDGVRVLTDGNFPFEHRFLTPRLTASKTNFTVLAKATDTGGNFTWSDEIDVARGACARPPARAETSLFREHTRLACCSRRRADFSFAFFRNL